MQESLVNMLRDRGYSMSGYTVAIYGSGPLLFGI